MEIRWLLVSILHELLLAEPQRAGSGAELSCMGGNRDHLCMGAAGGKPVGSIHGGMHTGTRACVKGVRCTALSPQQWDQGLCLWPEQRHCRVGAAWGSGIPGTEEAECRMPLPWQVWLWWPGSDRKGDMVSLGHMQRDVMWRCDVTVLSLL